MTAPVRHPLPHGTPKPHAVVIGSGLGGLAAAARLGARGYQVTVLEKLDQPGGRARMFRQDGFSFDAGPTIITAPFVFEELWQFCGAKLSDDVTLVPAISMAMSASSRAARHSTRSASRKWARCRIPPSWT
jgi:phytoene desaturase